MRQWPVLTILVDRLDNREVDRREVDGDVEGSRQEGGEMTRLHSSREAVVEEAEESQGVEGSSEEGRMEEVDSWDKTPATSSLQCSLNNPMKATSSSNLRFTSRGLRDRCCRPTTSRLTRATSQLVTLTRPS